MTSKSHRTAKPSDDAPEAEGPAPAARKAAERTPELPDADPPEKLSALAGEYIGLSIAGGLIVGLLIGAFFPRSAARKAAGRSSKLATAAGEVGLAMATKALSRAGAAVRDGREKAIDMGELVSESVAGHAGPVLASAGRMLGDSAEKARGAGGTLARKAADIVAKVQSHS